MALKLLQRIKSIFQQEPNPEFMAQQLRKPSGNFAGKVAEKMDQANEPLHSLTLSCMDLSDNDSVLEIGFGSGRFFEKLFEKANGVQVNGIDYSKEMVELAKEYNRAFITTGQLNLLQGSSDNLPFADNSFDKVFCNMVIYFWDQPEPHLKEIHRVLKPGGMYFTGFRPRESMLAFPFVQYGFRLYGTSDWRSVLQENGFAVTSVESKSDPAINHEDLTIQLESVCITAVKKSRERQGNNLPEK